MTKRYPSLLGCLAAIGLASPALAQPVGPEFQVNTYTTGPQQDPKVASDASGNFVVVWESTDQDGSARGVFGQRYDRDGNRLGAEFQVPSHPRGHQELPAVASDVNGNFVVVWKGDYPINYGIIGRRFDAGGNALGNDFKIGASGFLQGRYGPSIASNANGDFIAAWTDDGGIDYDVRARRYDRDGNPLGDAFVVNTYVSGDQVNPAIASDAAGNFVVVWVDGAYFDGQDGSLSGVFGQRYDSHGNSLDEEFPVNTYTTGRQGSYTEGPSIASDANGNFVVVWRSTGQDGSDLGVFGQRFDNNGSPVGGEFQVNTYTTDEQSHPAVTSDPAGTFVVVWESDGQDGSDLGVFGKRFDSAGNALGSEFQANSYVADDQSGPSVASDGAGNFVVAWHSEFQDGGGGSVHNGVDRGVFGQRFSAGCEAAVQVEGDLHAPGSNVVIRVHIAHRRPKTVTVPWELRLLDPSGQRVAWRTTEPHTFEPGDVVDRNVEFRLPDDLAPGTYTLELAISGMAGTKGATTTIQVVRAESETRRPSAG